MRLTHRLLQAIAGLLIFLLASILLFHVSPLRHGASPAASKTTKDFRWSTVPEQISKGISKKAPGQISEQIVVDQFGWRPDAVKVALFADPQRGQNSSIHYQPGETFELRQVQNHRVVYRGPLESWKEGAVDASSGDRVWSADFSNFTTEGDYYLYDPAHQLRSYSFAIRDRLYAPVLKAAGRVFYYQRCGTEIEAEHGDRWTHAPCHIGPSQDYRALRHTTGDSPRDVHGGWHDAGDYNKYIPFTAKTLWNLVDAYENNPDRFGDDWNLPESGNGVPDLLDELKWELDWMLRMQLENGSVINRVASDVRGEIFPDSDDTQRYYTEPTTWATASFIVGIANTSRIFQAYEQAHPEFIHRGYGDRLLTAAERAWTYLERTPNKFPADGHDYGDQGTLSVASQASEDGGDQLFRRWAAAELFRATGRDTYKHYFEHYAPWLEEPWFDSNLHLGYVAYAKMPEADPKRVMDVKEALAQTLSGFDNLAIDSTDPYRAYISDYHWGSNRNKADWGVMFFLARSLGVELTTVAEDSAEEYLHYFHGRNPLAWVYLSNMGEKGANLGAEKSVMQLYHSWFNEGSRYDGEESQLGPAPGFLTGGPNQYYAVKSVAPPYGEPHQKAFKDWNNVHNRLKTVSEASWEITEPAIYYQAAYLDLLSYFGD